MYEPVFSGRADPRDRTIPAYQVQHSVGYKIEEDDEIKAPKRKRGQGEDSESDEDSQQPAAKKSGGSGAVHEKAKWFDSVIHSAMKIMGVPTQHIQRGDKVCQLCKKTVKTTARLKEHINKVHHHKGKFSCQEPDCEKTFSERANLEAHTQKEHKGKGYPCKHEGCTKKFTTEKSLKRHGVIHIPGPQLECKFCGKNSTTKDYCRSMNLLVRTIPNKYSCLAPIVLMFIICPRFWKGTSSRSIR